MKNFISFPFFFEFQRNNNDSIFLYYEIKYKNMIKRTFQLKYSYKNVFAKSCLKFYEKLKTPTRFQNYINNSIQKKI